MRGDLAETMPALCWCQAEVVPATRQQVLAVDVYCHRCEPVSVCSLCAGSHKPVSCPLSVGYRRRPRRDRGVAQPRRQRVHAAALSLPVFGEWPGWMTVLTVGLVALYVLQRVVHRADRGPSDAPDVPQPGDMSTLAGWDEYVIGQRLERECGPDREARS